EKQISVGLVGIRLLRILVHDDLAIEHAVRGAVEDALVKLQASRSRPDMLDLGEVIDVLPPGAEIESVEHAFGAFSVERYVHVIAHERAAQSHRMRRQMAT